MKNSFLFSIIFLFFYLSLSNATIIYVSGNVSGIWSVDTVIVTGEVIVSQNSSLIIEPGVKVLFQSYCKFIVDTNATLQAIGTVQDTILFDEFIPNNHWKGIRFLCAGDSCQLKYCHLTHGYAYGGGEDNKGGAIYCSNSNPTVQNCLIDSCSANQHGGGIVCDNNSNPIISGNTISQNSATYFGGGIYCSYSSNSTISGNTISENSGWEGSGIYCYNSNPCIRDNIINGNHSGGAGGGIYCYQSNPTISGNTISLNSSGYGGGILCTIYSNPIISGNIISENSAYYGGGIYCISSHPIINNNIIRENSANWGGGISYISSSPSTFIHNDISDNTALNGGGICLFCVCLTLNKCTVANNSATVCGGIYCDSSSPILDNCIIWGNAPQQFFLTPSSNIIATYSDIQGSWPGTGNIDLYPMFVDSALGDYHLLSNSPCIDTGDPNPIYNDPDFTRADMGCYYFDQGFSNPITLTLTPQNPPIIIPAGGGSFNFIIEISNSNGYLQFITVVCNVTLPDGTIFGPVLGPVSVTLNGGSSISRLRTQNVPAGAPAGNYTYNAYAIVQGDTVSDSFPFVKLGAGEGSFVNNWDNTGENFEELYAANKIETPTPSSFALRPNYPNPFNSSTIIAFDLSVASEVSLKVYDISGRETQSLVIGHLSSGEHRVEWNAEGLPSGIYFARLQAGEFTQTQKLVLMK